MYRDDIIAVPLYFRKEICFLPTLKVRNVDKSDVYTYCSTHRLPNALHCCLMLTAFSR